MVRTTPTTEILLAVLHIAFHHGLLYGLLNGLLNGLLCELLDELLDGLLYGMRHCARCFSHTLTPDGPPGVASHFPQISFLPYQKQDHVRWGKTQSIGVEPTLSYGSKHPGIFVHGL